MSFDDRMLGELVEQSEDLHRDAMSATRTPLAELTELGMQRRATGVTDLDEVRAFQSQRRRFMRRGMFTTGALATSALATAGLGTAILAVMESPAFADQGTDVQMLQTAASIENLAVATYKTALTLDFIGGSTAIPVVKAFVEKTMTQHLGKPTSPAAAGSFAASGGNVMSWGAPPPTRA